MNQAGVFVQIWAKLEMKTHYPIPGNLPSFFSRSSHPKRVPLALAPPFLENLTLISVASAPGAGGFKLGNKPSDGQECIICVVHSVLRIPTERGCCILIICK